MDSALGAGDFICGADEDADFVGKCSGGELCLNPRSDVLFLVFHVGMGGDFGWHTVEGADGVVSRFHIPVGDFRAEKGFVESQTQRGHGVDIDALGESWLGSQEAAELGFQSTGERFGECGEEDSGLGLGASKETRCR